MNSGEMQAFAYGFEVLTVVGSIVGTVDGLKNGTSRRLIATAVTTGGLLIAAAGATVSACQMRAHEPRVAIAQPPVRLSMNGTFLLPRGDFTPVVPR